MGNDGDIYTLILSREHTQPGLLKVRKAGEPCRNVTKVSFGPELESDRATSLSGNVRTPELAPSGKKSLQHRSSAIVSLFHFDSQGATKFLSTRQIDLVMLEPHCFFWTASMSGYLNLRGIQIRTILSRPLGLKKKQRGSRRASGVWSRPSWLLD